MANDRDRLAELIHALSEGDAERRTAIDECASLLQRYLEELKIWDPVVIEMWTPILIEMWERRKEEDSIPPLPADLIASMQRDQTTGSRQREMMLIFLIWLAATGLPIIGTKLTAKEHTMLEDWIGTFSIAIALTAAIMARNKHAGKARP
jgi:hypothetical protein